MGSYKANPPTPPCQGGFAPSLIREGWGGFELRFFKDILASAAQRAAPISRDIFKGCAGGNAVIRVSGSWIILILADSTDILLHRCSPLVFFDNPGVSGFPADGLHRTAVNGSLDISFAGPFRIKAF